MGRTSAGAVLSLLRKNLLHQRPSRQFPLHGLSLAPILASSAVGDTRATKRFCGDDDSRLFSTTTTLLENDKPHSSILESFKASEQWKRGKLTKLESKFASHEEEEDEDEDEDEVHEQEAERDADGNIQHERDLQPMWREMESRVTKRRSLAPEPNIKTGRSNIRPTEEEAWLQAGLYNQTEKEEKNDNR